MPIMAMLTNQGKVKRWTNSKENTGKFDSKCNHSNKCGHQEDQCWIKHPELKPEKGRQEGREKPKFSMRATGPNDNQVPTSSALIQERRTPV